MKYEMTEMPWNRSYITFLIIKETEKLKQPVPHDLTLMQEDETEVLIRIISFGPMIRVVAPGKLRRPNKRTSGKTKVVSKTKLATFSTINLHCGGKGMDKVRTKQTTDLTKNSPEEHLVCRGKRLCLILRRDEMLDTMKQEANSTTTENGAATI